MTNEELEEVTGSCHSVSLGGLLTINSIAVNS